MRSSTRLLALRRLSPSLFTLSVFAALSAPLRAQDAAPTSEASPSAAPTVAAPAVDPNADQDVLKMDQMLVTAVGMPKQETTKMKAAVSVSTVSMSDIEISVPRSTSEIFRNIPAIRAEASSGDGNTNIAVRGLPITTGGAKYLQLQEDGLPVLMFGDIAFGTSDDFLRADYTVGNIEAVRGGSASTFATNAPGGVINFVSRTGEVAGGSIGLTRGLDFDQTRVDFNYGGTITQGLRFNVGGFYRTGEGAKTAGYTANDGGQFKVNLTKEFEKGYIRVYFKALDDRTLSFMPVPMKITGSDSSPTYSSLPGFNLLTGAVNSPYLTSVLATTYGHNTRAGNVQDGIHSVSNAIGAEASFELPGEWHITDKFRHAANSGDFIDPYVAATGDAQTIANGLAGTGATLKYANGPLVGQSISSPSTLNGNGLLMRVHLFNTHLNDLGNTVNDLKANKSFTLNADNKIDVTLGYFSSRQAINMDWIWNAYLMEVKGKNAALVDVYNSSGVKQTDGGLIAYGTNYNGGWGNLQRNYDVKYDGEAPYGSINYKFKKLTLDAGVREDYGRARGSYADTVNTSYDVNNDGVISVPEKNVSVIDLAHPSPVNYNWNFTSYTFGANYLFNKNTSAFARYSKGGSAGADRELWANGLVTSGGKFVSGGTPVADAEQTELGVKWRSNHLVPGSVQLYVTLFDAKASEVSNDPTLAAKGLPSVFSANYHSKGSEIELGYSYHGFALKGNVTYTHSRNTDNDTVPQRTPDWMYQLMPSYTWKKLTAGLAFAGVSASHANNGDKSGTGLMMPAYHYTNAFVSYEVLKNLTVSLSVNNLFNDVGITEVDSGRQGSANNVINARSITGRTTAVALKYNF